MMELSNIEKKVLEINSLLIENISIKSNFGLLSGLSGHALFLYYFEKYYNDKNQNCLYNTIEEILKSTLEYNSSSSFCSGIAGICYLFADLYKKERIKIEIEGDVIEYMNLAVKHNIEQHNFEFLYGLMGISRYLLMTPEVYSVALVNIITFLNDTKEVLATGYRWKKFNQRTGIYEYNLSMSHGSASIIVILSKIYNEPSLFSMRDKIKNLIIESVNYTLSQEIDVNQFGSFFSYLSDKNGPIKIKSRLAWCYGDLGISLALWQAGNTLDIIEWKNKAENILLYAAKNRRILEDNRVIDAGLCHGTAGIAAVFYRMWWNTCNVEYKNAADYWIEETIKMAKYEHGLAGYLMLGPSYSWEKCYNLLEGISGIGMVLLCYSKNIEPIWDECLLMS